MNKDATAKYYYVKWLFYPYVNSTMQEITQFAKSSAAKTFQHIK